jgi:hypothetical protein
MHGVVEDVRKLWKLGIERWTDSCGIGFYRKLTLVVGCSVTDDDDDDYYYCYYYYYYPLVFCTHCETLAF